MQSQFAQQLAQPSNLISCSSDLEYDAALKSVQHFAPLLTAPELCSHLEGSEQQAYYPAQACSPKLRVLDTDNDCCFSRGNLDKEKKSLRRWAS